MRLSNALSIWRDRRPRSAPNIAFTAYTAVAVAAIAIFPILRALWLTAFNPDTVSLLLHPSASAWLGFAVSALWASALILGSKRGPALRSPFLTYALASSGMPRTTTFHSPMLLGGMVVTTTTTAITALIGGALFAHGHVGLIPAVCFAAGGLLTGMTASVLWLLGQAHRRLALPLSAIVLATGIAVLALPSPREFMPGGWLSLAHPTPTMWGSLTLLSALALTLVMLTPSLLNRLDFDVLMTQSRRWESTMAFSASMDFDGAASLYRIPPKRGRRWAAVPPTRSRSLMFLRRDFIGAIRTPSRLMFGMLIVAAAGVLLTLAFLPTAPAWLLGTGAGLLLLFGIGPFTDGLRHATAAVSDLPLYGISDERLLAYHALFPLTAVTLLLVVVALACCLAAGINLFGPLIASMSAGFLMLATRVAGFLKGPMPPSLMAPIPTPMGDLSIVVRGIRALDGIVFAGILGAAAALAFELPILLAVAGMAAIGLAAYRWRARART